jgi:hypothetical protein
MWRLSFPSLRGDQAPMPYEIAVAILLAWVGESIHRVDAVMARYPVGHWLWRFIDETDLERVIPYYCLAAAMLICFGLFRKMRGCSSGRASRAIGLTMGAVLFAFIAFGHLSVTFYSIAGAPYLFLAWRFAVLAIVYVREA